MDVKKKGTTQKRKRGRPATGKDPMLAFRSPPDLTKRIEAMARADADRPTRSEMLRRLLEWAVEMKERRK